MSSRLLALTALLLLVVALPVVAEDEPAGDPVERVLTSPPATGLLVTVVAAETQAQALGIALGDTIVAYAGKPTATVDDLRAAMQGAADAESIEVEVVRADGSKKTFTAKPGRIGVQLAPVVKGEGAEPLPPATKVAFDFSALEGSPHDDWYDFALGAGGHAGFEHGTTKLEEGKLVMRREVAFEGGGGMGVNHFDVTVVMTATAAPEIVSIRFENPITGYVGEGEMTTTDAGRVLRYTHNGNEAGPETIDRAVPKDLPAIPSYLVETLACFMPREKGACFHYRPVTDGFGDIGRPSALLAVGEEEIEVRGAKVAAFKYRVLDFGGAGSTAFWVDGKGRVVKADYGGAQTEAAPKEEVLKDLHHGLQPRTAD